jgi:hypothetical protein
MSLKSLQLKQAMRLVMATLPIALVRLGTLLLFWLAAMLYLAIVGGIAWLVGQAIPLVGVILFLVGIGGTGFLYQYAQRYVLYLIKAAQIAVMAELMVRQELPPGVNQLAWGKQRVQERFGESSAMFVVDQLVAGVVGTFTGAVYRISAFLPGNFFRNIANVVNRVIRFAVTYIDEAILARSFWTDSEDVWANARDGVVLYGMVWKPLLMNAIALMLLSYIPFVAVLIIISLPVGLLLSIASPAVTGWLIIVTLILAWLVKVAIGDTFAMAAMISAYQRETDGLIPDPAMTARLEQISDKFRSLQERARESFAAPDSVTEPLGAPPASPDWAIE